jgi:hypothetical protein
MSQIISDFINNQESNLWYIDRMASNRTIYPMNYTIYNIYNINNTIDNTIDNISITNFSLIDISYNSINYDIDVGPTIPFIRTQIEITVNDNLDITREQQDCCICMMEQIERVDICKLNCNHTFCGLCVGNILSKQDQTYNCPLCREEINEITVQTQENKNKLSEL